MICKAYRRPGWILLLSTIFPFLIFAQPSGKSGNWTMFFGQLRFHDKWSWHAEAQYRDYGMFDEPEQIMLRTGLNFHPDPNVVLSAGYAHIPNFLDDGELFETPVVSENRVWQQLQTRHKVERFYFEHRYRMEERWLRSAAGTRYRERIRYLFRLSVPLNKKELTKGALFLGFYDELFMNFARSPFDRNRLYFALGYQFLPSANIQMGYMAQTVGSVTKNYFQTALFYTLDTRKTK